MSVWSRPLVCPIFHNCGVSNLCQTLRIRLEFDPRGMCFNGYWWVDGYWWVILFVCFHSCKLNVNDFYLVSSPCLNSCDQTIMMSMLPFKMIAKASYADVLFSALLALPLSTMQLACSAEAFSSGACQWTAPWRWQRSFWTPVLKASERGCRSIGVGHF